MGTHTNFEVVMGKQTILNPHTATNLFKIT